ncbi:MAG: hypothetical protein ACOYLB_12045 [Phototrophicaceae bacterium]
MGYEVSLIQHTPPIVLLEIEGMVKAPDMVAHLDSIEACLQEHGLLSTMIYLMVDVQQADMSFSDVIRGAQTHAIARRGSSNDPLTIAMFVGTKPMIVLLGDLFRAVNPNVQLPLFHTREQALDFVRVQSSNKE